MTVISKTVTRLASQARRPEGAPNPRPIVRSLYYLCGASVNPIQML
jgi:hypothetical protein